MVPRYGLPRKGRGKIVNIPLRQLRIENQKKSIYECRAKGCGRAYKYKRFAEICHGDRAWVVRISKEEYETICKIYDMDTCPEAKEVRS